MKDSLLINSGLPVNFWAETINRNNYLRNRLSTRQNGPAFILEEVWTSTRQNLEYVQIFESRVSIFILIKKRIKLNIRKTRKGILIGYIGSSKHLRVCASCTHQVLITSEPIVNESKRGADLLLEHLLPPPEKHLQP